MALSKVCKSNNEMNAKILENGIVTHINNKDGIFQTLCQLLNEMYHKELSSAEKKGNKLHNDICLYFTDGTSKMCEVKSSQKLSLEKLSNLF